MTIQPLVSIVTPVYQMARFVEETVQSVLAQDYPHIEYIVMDGGSTDGTLEILRRYQRLKSGNVVLRCYSEPDRGTADAVNKGFARSHGSVVAYLNADDTYAKDAVSKAVQALMDDPAAEGVYGEANWMGVDGSVIGRYPTRPFEPRLLQTECFICQPASFLRREAFERAGMLDASLDYAYDYEFWIRFAGRFQLRHITDRLAAARMHDGSKTFRDRRKVLREAIKVQGAHFGYAPFRSVLAYTGHLIDGRDQFFDPFRPSVTKYLGSLPVGWCFNWRRPVSYFREWASVMNLDCLTRRVLNWSRGEL